MADPTPYDTPEPGPDEGPTADEPSEPAGEAPPADETPPEPISPTPSPDPVAAGVGVAPRATASGRAGRSQTSNVVVREIELGDLAAVFALGERLFTAEGSTYLYRTWDEYEVASFFMSDGETSFVAELDGQVVGFALGALIEKRRSAWTYGYVVWLGVAPSLGRRGVGARLLHTLQDRFIELGARMALADTAADNTQALRFFEREGYGNPEHHVYMSLNLTRLPEYQKHRERQRAHQPTRSLSRTKRGRTP